MLRFPNQSDIQSKLPSLQERFKATFPLRESVIQHTISVVENSREPSLNTINPVSIKETHFFDSEKKSGIIILEDRCIYHTVSYPKAGFEEFSKSAAAAFLIVKDIFDLSYYISIGVRTIDVIECEIEEKFSDYLNAKFTPLVNEGLDLNLYVSKQEYNFNTELGRLNLIVHYTPEADYGVPLEMQSMTDHLNLEKKFEEAVVIDIDHMTENIKGTGIHFDIDEIMKKSKVLHDMSSDAFRKIVINDLAFKKWGK